VQLPTAAAWPSISKGLLTPAHPFAVHQLLAAAAFSCWDTATLGPHPLYVPTPQTASGTNAARFIDAHPELFPGDADADAATAAAATLANELGLPAATQQLMQQWDRLHALSVHEPHTFWPLFLQAIAFDFAVQPRATLELAQDANPDGCHWFPGARLNIAAAALSGRLHDPDDPAIVVASESDPHRCDAALQAM
jgi:acetyl-CoA synthetase